MFFSKRNKRILKDKNIESLWPLKILNPKRDFSVGELSTWSMHELNKQFTGDQLYDNLLLNKYEFAQGKSVLKSYPWRFSFPFSRCNAKCEFCKAWLSMEKPISPETLELLNPVIRHCVEIDLVGWGEPLIHPQFDQILANLKTNSDPRAKISLTTNGVLLKKWADKLLTSNINDFGISIHAATAQTHHDLMNLESGSFDEVIEGIRYLVESREKYPRITISVVFILMKQNIQELPRFIQLFNEIGVDQIFVRTLMPRTSYSDMIGLNYHLLPPYLHPDFDALRQAALAAIKKSKIPILVTPETWDKPVFPPHIEEEIRTLPPKSFEVRVREYRDNYPNQSISSPPPCGEAEDETGHETGASRIISLISAGMKDQKSQKSANIIKENPYNRTAPYDCPSPYTAFYIRSSGEVRPCCYIDQIEGHRRIYLAKSDITAGSEGENDFFRVWNSPAMVSLRQRLNHGPLMDSCLHCPYYW